MSENIEHTFLDLLLPKTKPFLIGILYRPPQQDGFLQKVSLALTNISNYNDRQVYILEDLSINLMYRGRKIPV